MIRSFEDGDTEDLFHQESTRMFGSASRVALRKLIQLDQARDLRDLSVPPGNRLEKLRGNLSDFHSIRVNNRWRIIFVWTRRGAERVSVVDYH